MNRFQTEEWKQRKREYYLKNRHKRLAYQNQYYAQRKAREERERELMELLEPEKVAEIDARAKARRERARAAYQRCMERKRERGLKNQDTGASP